MEKNRDDEYLNCPQCRNKAEALFRNKPKGEKADFVCIHCLPPSMKPDSETVAVADGIWGAINALD